MTSIILIYFTSVYVYQNSHYVFNRIEKQNYRYVTTLLNEGFREEFYAKTGETYPKINYSL